VTCFKSGDPVFASTFAVKFADSAGICGFEENEA
jgi:hypothetical protein